MNRILALAALLAASFAPAFGQATIPVSGAAVKTNTLTALTGRVLFTVTDINDVAIAYTPLGGTSTTAPISVLVTAGAVQLVSGSPPQIPNPATMYPTNTRYRLQVQNFDGSITYDTFPLVNVTGASFSLDSYVVPIGTTATGTGYPRMPCTPQAQYKDVTNSAPYPWVCSKLKDGTVVWTQSPANAPAICSGGNTQALASPAFGSPYCIDVTQAYVTPGYVYGGPTNGLADHVGLVPTLSGGGAWSQTATYSPGAVVKYGTSNYLALLTNINVLPGSDPLTWSVLASSSGGGSAGITTLTSDVNATGTGTASATVVGINGTPIGAITGPLKLTAGTPAVASATDISNLFSGSGTCLLSNGTKGPCGSGSGITALTTDVTASGTGSAPARVVGINNTPITGMTGPIKLTAGTPSVASGTDIAATFTGIGSCLLANGTKGPCGGTASTPGTNQVVVGVSTVATATPITIDPVTGAETSLTKDVVNSAPYGQSPQQVPMYHSYTVKRRYSTGDQLGVHNHNLFVNSGGEDILLFSGSGALTNATIDNLYAETHTPVQMGGMHTITFKGNSTGDAVVSTWDIQCGATDARYGEGCEGDRHFLVPNVNVFGGTLTLGASDAQGRQLMTIANATNFDIGAAGEGRQLLDVSKAVTLAGNATGTTYSGNVTILSADSALVAAMQSKFGATDTHVTTMTANADMQVYNGACPSTVTASSWPSQTIQGQTVGTDPYASDSQGQGSHTQTFCIPVASTATLTAGTPVGIFGKDSGWEFTKAITVADATHFTANLDHAHDAGSTVSWGAGVGYALGAPSSDFAPGILPAASNHTQHANLKVTYPIVAIVGGSPQLYNYNDFVGSLLLNLYSANTPTTAATATGTFSGGALTAITITPNDYTVSGPRTPGMIGILPPPAPIFTPACTVAPVLTWAAVSPSPFNYQATIASGGSGCSNSTTITFANTYANPVTVYPMTKTFRVVDASDNPYAGAVRADVLASSEWVNGDTVQQSFNPNVFTTNQETFANPFMVAQSGHFTPMKTTTFQFASSAGGEMLWRNSVPDSFYFGTAAHGYLPNSINRTEASLGTPILLTITGEHSVIFDLAQPPVSNAGGASSGGFVKGGTIIHIYCKNTPLGGDTFDHPCARGVNPPFEMWGSDLTITHRGEVIDPLAGTVLFNNVDVQVGGKLRTALGVEINSGALTQDALMDGLTHCAHFVNGTLGAASSGECGTGGGGASPATSSVAGTVQLAPGQTSNVLSKIATTGLLADAAQDTAHNSAFVYSAGTLGDTSCPAPSAGSTIDCYHSATASIWRSVNGAAFYDTAAGGTSTAVSFQIPRDLNFHYAVADVEAANFDRVGLVIYQSGTVYWDSPAVSGDGYAAGSVDTTATVNSFAGLYTGHVASFRNNPSFQVLASLTSATNVSVWLAATDHPSNSVASHLNPGTDLGYSMIGFRHINGTDANWSCAMNTDTSTTTAVDSGVAINPNVIHEFDVIWVSGTPQFYIDKTRVCAGIATTNQPVASTDMGLILNLTNTTATAQRLRLFRAYLGAN